MPFFYIYHSLRRRTRFEEQQDFIFAWRSWCCCAVSMEARSNRMGTRTHARGTPGTGLYSKIVMVCAQCALRGSCLWTCSLCSWSVAACLRCHVAGVCVAMLVVPRGSHNQRAPPRVALLAELNCRCACEMFVFSWKCELFSWVCMVDGSHKRREGACFWATEIPPCRTPMSSNWVLDVRN